MKYSIAVKFIAIILCALMLLGAAASGISLIGLGSMGILSGQTTAQAKEEQIRRQAAFYAEEMVSVWASETYGEMPEDLTAVRRECAETMHFRQGTAGITIYDADGEEVFSNWSGDAEQKFSFTLGETWYPHFLSYGDSYFKNSSETEIQAHPGSYITSFYSVRNGRSYVYSAYEEQTQGLSATVYLAMNATGEESVWQILELLEIHQNHLIVVLGISLLLFAALAVYLCCSAGHKRGSGEIRAAGLNALPLDLYAAAPLGYLVLCAVFLDEVGSDLIEQNLRTVALVLGGMGYLGCLLAVGWCFAFAAQVKMPGYHWWWNSLCGRCLKLCGKLVKWCFRFLGWMIPRMMHFIRAGFRLCIRIAKDAWKIALALLSLGWSIWLKVWRWCMKWLHRGVQRAERFFSLLPLTWQWLGVGAGIVIILSVTMHGHGAQGIVLGVLACLAIVLYGANCFGTLMEAVKKLRGGELEAKVDDKHLVGSFREFAEELNGLADVAMIAAQRQLKSERMKTELITNVSHDIKTPLTSIINYVDLLEKPHTPEEEKTYLEVLSRQAQRMKKLIEDLMEMSKASTGNIPVEITRIDAAEAVNQALGEFADKLTSAGLTPVFHQPEEEITLLADGRLLWRAMSNILSNAVKYALPGTRLYVDVSAVEDKAVISFKNISGAELNISADELMERFVRGDSSRNTEGSGLGLNIAKSLMELQRGQLQLLVDGDLFKVTLVFPRA